jgi:hypothetical protein
VPQTPKLTPFERLELLKKVQDFGQQINRLLDGRLDSLDEGWAKVSAGYYKNLSDQLLQTLQKLDTRGGRIENSDENIAKVKRLTKEIEAASKKITKEGAKFLAENGRETIEQIATKTEKFFADNMPAGAGDFLVISPKVIEKIVGQSILVWDDSNGELAREIQTRLLGIVIRGEDIGTAIREYAKTVPAIEKPRRGGGTFKLSAEERAEITMSTEFVRMFEQANTENARLNYGDNYYVQNLNPMDERTSPQCTVATEAGIVKQDFFLAEHGEPPRHPRCRCSLATIPPFLMDKK